MPLLCLGDVQSSRVNDVNGMNGYHSHNTKSLPLLFSAAMTPSPCPPAGHRGRRLKEYKFCPNCSSREMALYPAGLQAEVSGSSVSTRK